MYDCGYDLEDHCTLAENTALLKQQQELLFEPGAQWSYCNSNYLLLAQIVEKVTGATFQEWIQRHVLEPVGMKNSLVMKNSSQIIMGKAEPYRQTKGELIKNSGPWVNSVGMGYLFTNPEDMIHWLDNFRTGQVGGADLIKKMCQKAKLNDGRESFYGYGLGVSTRTGHPVVSHSGQTAGYKTAMLYCPELELGITVLANERSINAEGLAKTIFDLYTGQVVATPAAEEKADVLPFNAESAARFDRGGYVVEGLHAEVALNVAADYLHGPLFGLGEDFFYPLSETLYANRSRVNFFEFAENGTTAPDQETITIRKDKMTARRIVLDQTDWESRLQDYLGSSYSDTFSIIYTFRAENGRLVMHHRRYGDLRLEPIDQDEFFFIQGFVKFNRNEQGGITGFTLTPSDEKFHLRRIEFKKMN